MAAGLWTWDAQGNNMISAADRLGRVTGGVYTNAQNGSVVVPGYDEGAIWAVYMQTDQGNYTPNLSWDGTSVYWSYPNGPKSNVVVIFGVR